MAYRQRGKIYSIEGDTFVVQDEKSGEKTVIPLSDIAEVRMWTLTVESGCLIRTRSHGRYVVRCGIVPDTSFMSFVVDLHMSLMERGHNPVFLRGNKVLLAGGWLLMSLLIACCGIFVMQNDLAWLAALSFWRIAILFCMVASLTSFAYAAIRAGRIVAYHPEELMSPRKRLLAEMARRRAEE